MRRPVEDEVAHRELLAGGADGRVQGADQLAVPLRPRNTAAQRAVAAVGRSGQAAFAGARSGDDAGDAGQVLEQLGVFGVDEIPPERLVRAHRAALGELRIELQENIVEGKFLVLEPHLGALPGREIAHATQVVAPLIGAAAARRRVLVELAIDLLVALEDVGAVVRGAEHAAGIDHQIDDVVAVQHQRRHVVRADEVQRATHPGHVPGIGAVQFQPADGETRHGQSGATICSTLACISASLGSIGAPTKMSDSAPVTASTISDALRIEG